MLVKIKAGEKYKARMCLRGDQEPLARTSFSSAPTASRDLLKIAISSFANDKRFECLMVDISQAFVQRDSIAVSERSIALASSCMAAGGPIWKGTIKTDSKSDVYEVL